MIFCFFNYYAVRSIHDTVQIVLLLVSGDRVCMGSIEADRVGGESTGARNAPFLLSATVAKVTWHHREAEKQSDKLSSGSLEAKEGQAWILGVGWGIVWVVSGCKKYFKR